ncbi:MAG: FtsX-like permease family protein [Planctomycetes bacterium]|nr:FtsX-like permease family protein [Planctomycetota bacterium]
MSALDRKLLRDMFQMKTQLVAICLVIASGVAVFVMALSTLDSLRRSQATYYERYRFAHVFSHLKRAPNSLAERVAKIPGVSQAQTRIVADVTLDIPSLEEPAVGRLISVPDRWEPMLNDVHLRSGRYIEAENSGEVLVSESFTEAHGFQPGDTLSAVINGRRQELKIVGIALSPEYIYQIRPGDIFPDARTFGVVWMGRTQLAAAFDMEGAFNDVSLSLMPGASEAEVIRRLDLLTEPYGGLGAYGRNEQVSHRFLNNEIFQLESMGRFIPMIFLAVAAFLLNVVLTRIVNTQREQIAALKAFGYGNLDVGVHYLKLVMLVTLLGVVLGCAWGAYFGQGLTSMYTRFYRFPVLEFHVPLSVVFGALGVSSGAAMLGTWGSVRRAASLPPAEAMRPEPPARYRPTILERWGAGRWFSQTTRMILRHLERRPLSALMSILGIALAAAIMVLGNFTADALDLMLEFQFFLAQRQDMTVVLIEPGSTRAYHSIAHLPGVQRAEPFRAVAVRLRHEHLMERVQIMGLEPAPQLYRLLDKDMKPVLLPPEGLVLNSELAKILGAEVGESVTVEVLEGERFVRQVPVTGLVDEFIGLAAYMDIRALRRLLQEGRTVSGAYLSVDPDQVSKLYATLKETPHVAGVNIKLSALRSLQETMADHLLRMRAINVMFASIIAFGVVYNSARISLAERSRELASLRVLGLTRGEISYILLGELAVLTLLAVPLGMVIGYGLSAAFIIFGQDTELFRIPLVVYRSTFGLAATTVIVAAIVSGLVVRRRLDHLDLVAVLKTRE